MKKGKMVGVVVMAAGLLTGCIDHMPDMTEEQSALIAEYAADMLLKYSPNYDYRIADEEAFVEEMEEAAAEETSSEQTTIEVETQVGEEEVQTETKNAEETLNVIDASEVDFAEMFGMEDVAIRYDSMELCATYPAEETGTGFAVSAAQGNTLIVMHFEIENTIEEDITCDLFEKDFDVSMNLNGGNYKKVSSTMLVNDFTTYIEEIPAGESKEAVIVAEVGEITEDEITSCIFRITTGGVSITAKLK